MPFRVRPMLATLVDAPFHRPGFVYEEKYDGYRILAYKEGRHVSLITRNLKDRTDEFPEIATAVGAFPAPSLALDGEIVVFETLRRESERSRVSRFQLLQRRSIGDAPIYVVFDCLYARGRDLRRLPLADRRKTLEAELREGSEVMLARRLDGDGFAAFREAKRLGLEGVVAKDESSPYVDSVRSPAWLKVKVRLEEEFVIGGYTEPEGARQHFGALLVGAYRRGKLAYAGKVGTGFPARVLADLVTRFRPLARDSSPFDDAPRERGVTWLEPRLVAQIGFTEITADGRLRHPTFLGLRDDKRARDVRWPVPAHTE